MRRTRSIAASILGGLTLAIGLLTITGSSPARSATFTVAIERSSVDNQPPSTVTITQPYPNWVFSGSPVNVMVYAYDDIDIGVASVGVAIYRNVGGGQYWNGTGWQTTNTVVPAIPLAIGRPFTNWYYSFTPPPGGVFAVAAIAYDAAGNFTIAPYQNFYVTDNVAPRVTLTTPTPSQALRQRPVVITGLATDNAGVGDTQIAIYRPTEAGQFWNGKEWQASYTTVSATLANPGATTTTYTYSFDPPQAGGYFYTAAIALDTSYNYSLTPFTLFTLPDTTAPTARIKTPTAGLTEGTLTIFGSATDDVAVNRVGIAIYRASTGQYWNGTDWKTDFATIPATLTTPGDSTTTYTLDYIPPAPDTYYIAAVPSDGNYNYSITPFTIVNHQ
jgi:large repetitive protein